jgi:hypothetical protein
VLGAIALQSAAPTEEAFPNGTPLSIASAIPASNWDLGGQGLAFQANNVCGIGYYTALGADRLNVYQTTDTTSPNGLKVGCNELNDYHKYTVNIPSSGTYQITLRTAGQADTSGATYTVQDCNPTCVNVATGMAVYIDPTNPSYDTFGNTTSGSFSLSSGVQIIKIIVSAVGSSGFAGDIDSIQIASPGATTISGILLSNGTNFTTPASSGTTIDTITAQCSAGSCSGATFALSASGSCSTETSNGSFAISGSNLNIGGSTVNAGSYPIGIAVTLAGATNSGTCYPTTLVGAAAGSGTLTLTNGPPNLGEGTSGSCTASTCTWIEAGVSNEAVSDVYLDLAPMSQNYTATCPGAFTIADTTHFAITCASDGTRSVGHITTNGSLSAGDYATSVSANGVTQNIVVHAVSGTAVSCPGGAASESALVTASSAAGTNGVVTIPAGCTITVSSLFTPAADGQVFIGAGPLSSIINGAGTVWTGRIFVGIFPDGNNESWMNLQVENVNNNNLGGELPATAIQAGDGWVLRNLYMHDDDTAVGFFGCGSSIYNSRLIHNTYDGFHGEPINDGLSEQFTCPSTTPYQVIGTEWGTNNWGQSDTCNNVGEKFISGANYTLKLYNNYAHDNQSDGFWSDSEQYPNLYLYQNTFVNNGNNGIELEDTGYGGSGSSNIYNNFFFHNGDGTTPNPSTCGGAPYPNAQVAVNGTQLANIYNNNFIDGQATSSYLPNPGPSGAFAWEQECCDTTNDLFYDNSVTMLQTTAGRSGIDGIGDVLFTTAGAQISPNMAGTGAYSNNYHLVYSGANTSTDQHWNYNTGLTNFSTWQASGSISDGGSSSYAHPDTASLIDSVLAGTVDTSSSYEGTGCTHVACSNSGVGTNGAPD